MNCRELEDRLDDWVDGTLPETERRGLESHLSECSRCREQERRLRHLLAHASALPRSVSPPRDLWPDISRKIERERTWSWPRMASWQPVLAVAAAVVVALGAVILRPQAPRPANIVVVPSPATEPGYRVHPAAVEMDPGLVAMERDYQAAANALLAALQERRDELEPETLESVEQNLAVIDTALAEVHEALATDPASPELGRMLVSTHRKRVDVLRKMVKLSTSL
jgi:anti-sigma factor RsiW